LPNKTARIRSLMITMLLGGTAVLLVMFIIIYPAAVFQSALSGMKLWWDFVFPSLLPFLILSEIMMATGSIHAMGTILNPITRLLFRISPSKSWIPLMGLISGYPSGAKIIGSMQHKDKLSKEEAEQLLSLSHLCNPMVMIVVIGVCFFHQVSIGIYIAVVHYLTAFLTNIFMYRKSSHAVHLNKPQHNILLQSLYNAIQAQKADGRTFGKVLGDAVANSIQNLLLVGGSIMFFSVVIRVAALALPQKIMTGTTATLLPGLFEPHLGAYAISQSPHIPLLIKLTLISLVLSWSGLSVHIQVKGFIHQLKLRYFPFLLSRLMHASLAISLTPLLWKPYHLFSQLLSEKFSLPSNGTMYAAKQISNFRPQLATIMWLICLLVLILYIVSFIFASFKKLRS